LDRAVCRKNTAEDDGVAITETILLLKKMKWAEPDRWRAVAALKEMMVPSNKISSEIM
jgi:hypothetical protein